MKVGDKVTWTSQANANRRTKTGTIIAVVPAKEDPRKYIPDSFPKDQGFGFSRNHESYIVLLERGRSVLFWPRVCHLKLVHAG